MSKYKPYGSAKTRLGCHLIFSTKYRRKCLSGVEDSVREAFELAELRSEFKIVALGIDRNHAHLVITFKPAHSTPQVIRRLKQLTTKHLWDTEPEHLSNFYWGAKRGKLWTGGYFCETIGVNSESRVLEYVKNQ